MRFRLVHYDTKEEDRYAAEDIHEYLGSREAIWHLWYLLAEKLKHRHVLVYSLNGAPQKPELGINGLADCQP